MSHFMTFQYSTHRTYNASILKTNIPHDSHENSLRFLPDLVVNIASDTPEENYS